MPSIQQGRAAIPLPSAEINLGGASTNEKQFLTASATALAASGTTLILYAQGSNVLKNRPFQVVAGGRFTTGAAGIFTANIYWGTSSTSTSNTKIAAAASGSIAATSGTWKLVFDGTWDSTSSQICGAFQGYNNAKVISPTIISTSVTTVDLSGESTSNGFTVTGTFSAGNASNAAIVDYFELLTE